jgi:hypothetical protein
MAKFRRDGVELDLTRSEYIFVHLTLSHVLHGIGMKDHDFANILGMPRPEAEALLARIDQAEDAAKAKGEHWNPARPGSQ